MPSVDCARRGLPAPPQSLAESTQHPLPLRYLLRTATEKGGNPEVVRESQRRRYADVGLVDKVVALDQEWREGARAFTVSLRSSTSTAPLPLVRPPSKRALVYRCCVVSLER